MVPKDHERLRPFGAPCFWRLEKRVMPYRFAGFAIMALLAGMGARNARAAIIVYTDSVTASGFLGNDFFSNSAVTVTTFTDTADVETDKGFYSMTGPMTVTIASMNTTATVITDFVGVNFYVAPFSILNGKYIIAFEDDSQSGTILETQSYDFANYDLKTSIGPITGTSFAERMQLPTDQGGLVLTAAGDSTFTAILLETPEPASVILSSFGLVLLAIGAARSRFWNLIKT